MFQEIVSCQGSSVVEKEFFYEKETLYSEHRILL